MEREQIDQDLEADAEEEAKVEESASIAKNIDKATKKKAKSLKRAQNDMEDLELEADQEIASASNDATPDEDMAARRMEFDDQQNEERQQYESEIPNLQPETDVTEEATPETDDAWEGDGDWEGEDITPESDEATPETEDTWESEDETL